MAWWTPKTKVVATGVASAWVALAVTLVGAWEGLSTKTYRDSVGVPTICYGVTAVDRPVRMGQVETKDQCQKWLAEDLPRYDAMAHKCIPNIDSFPPHRHAAIVSFTYNVGEGNLCKSSVARGLNKTPPDLHGTRDHPLGCDALMMYDKAKGQTLKGLHNRRVQERQWCLMEN